MQLVAYGAQDIYLTGNPQITFFKVVYRRHTNFSMEAIQQTFNGNFSASGSTVTSTISRNGDLVTNLWLEIDITNTAANPLTTWTNDTGNAFVKQVELEIGGQRIDRHYDTWLNIWNSLSDHRGDYLVGLNKRAKTHTESFFIRAGNGIPAGNVDRLYVPLQFWFCRNPGLALPLIALQYHEVKVKLTTRAIDALVIMIPTGGQGGAHTPNTTAPSCKLYADYIYLDTDERRRFAQVSHEYLIEQVQRERGAMATTKKLNFNHPVKALYWVIQHDNVSTEVSGAGTAGVPNAYERDRVPPLYDLGQHFPMTATPTHGNDYFNYDVLMTTHDYTEYHGHMGHPYGFQTAKLQLNGHDRFSARSPSYFTMCQRAQHGLHAQPDIPLHNIYVYSFALKPLEHQPSGTCNFSRIDNAQLIFTQGTALSAATQVFTNQTITVYAVNYNVLRIMSGMGGLAYSN